MGKRNTTEDGAQVPQMHREEVEMDLECKLTQEDIRGRSAQLLQVSNERKAGTLRKESLSLKSKAKELDAKALESEQEAEMMLSEIEDLIRAVNDLVEKRPVKCVREYDYPASKIRVIRSDTGEIIEEREMRNSERQMALGFELSNRGQGKSGYVDKRGRFLFVSDGISDGTEWAAYYRSDPGTLKRFNPRVIAVSKTKDKAEEALKKYAEDHGFEYVEGDAAATAATIMPEAEAETEGTAA